MKPTLITLGTIILFLVITIEMFGFNNYSFSRLFAETKVKFYDDILGPGTVVLKPEKVDIISGDRLHDESATYFDSEKFLNNKEVLENEYPQISLISDFILQNPTSITDYENYRRVYKNHFNKDLFIVRIDGVHFFKKDGAYNFISLPGNQPPRCTWVSETKLFCLTFNTVPESFYNLIDMNTGMISTTKNVGGYTFFTNQYSQYIIGIDNIKKHIDIYRAEDMTLIRSDKDGYRFVDLDKTYSPSWFGPNHLIRRLGPGSIPTGFELYDITSGSKKEVTFPESIERESRFVSKFSPAVPLALLYKCTMRWSVWETNGCERHKYILTDWNTRVTAVEFNGKTANERNAYSQEVYVDGKYFLISNTLIPSDTSAIENLYSIDTDLFFNENRSHLEKK